MPEKGALLAVLIMERPLCVDCISEKSDLITDEVEPLLARIESKVALRRGKDRCRLRAVHERLLDRPSGLSGQFYRPQSGSSPRKRRFSVTAIRTARPARY
jgi:hypothetical protein